MSSRPNISQNPPSSPDCNKPEVYSRDLVRYIFILALILGLGVAEISRHRVRIVCASGKKSVPVAHKFRPMKFGCPQAPLSGKVQAD